jgi:hypothetical protein
MTDRERTIYDLARLGMSAYYIELVLRDLPAIQRAHEAECMAWPQEMIDAWSKRGDRAFARVVDALSQLRPVPVLRRQRDPRGCVIEIHAHGTSVDAADRGEPMLRIGYPGFTAREIERLDRYADRQTSKQG